MKVDKDNPTVQYGLLTWGPCVLQIKISEEFQKKLLDEAQSSRKESLSYRDKLAGVIKEEYSYQNKEMFLPEISQILGVYDQAFQKWKNTPYEKKPEYVLTSMWVNFMKKHEYNPPHEGQSGGPGSLAFLYGEGNRQAITYQSIFPKARDMFIFPAWLKHYVAPFYSDATRISVSGNIASSIDLNQLKNNEKETKAIEPAQVKAG
jgi:hypothetical protein